MAATVNQSHISQFSDNLHMLLEQSGSKLRKHISVEAASGDKQFFERLGSFTAKEVIGRLATTDLQDPAHSRRMATIRRYEASTYLDDIDKFKLLIDPASDYTRKLANAHGRNFDQVIINDVILGSASTGKDGSVPQAFDTTNNQIAHGSAGLTVAKFNQALRILQSAEVDIDQEELIMMVNARGLEDLFGDSTNQMTSFDYQGRKPLAEGGQLSFRGVPIVHTERINDETAGTTFRALLLSKDAVKVGMAHDLEVKVAERPDLNFAQQVSTYMFFGGVRMEESRVVDILFQ